MAATGPSSCGVQSTHLSVEASLRGLDPASIEGHNLREVGLLLGLPEGTVKSRLFLARKELKERLS